MYKFSVRSLSHWQYFEFIAECFTNPTVVSVVSSRDEQVLMFIEALKAHKITRVLDCGGGSGRLGLSMMEAKTAVLLRMCSLMGDQGATEEFKDYAQYL